MKKNPIILLLISIISCSENVENKESPVLYKEKYRPQFHFTPPSQWMNDPNGMFFYEGEYHLFYQYYPDSNVWGPMHWGHAVSDDMVKWEHLPIALYPDSLGYIFSGSAIVDWNNTSGFGAKGNPPIIAVYTYHDPVGEREGRIDFQSQGLAYSLDKGRTWTKYAKNPVLSNPDIRDFRDPKVTWYEPEKKWIMTLAVWDHVRFYESKDLKSWNFLSDFGQDWGSHAGVWECPDLFKMEVSNTEEERWVLLVSINPGGPQGGSATQYFVGHFDGQVFELDDKFSQELGTEASYFPSGEVYEDFEGGYEKWSVSGDAFGDQPANGSLSNQNAVNGFCGEGLVNSFLGGDISEGLIQSEIFPIEKPYINMLIGGGNDNNKTYMALVIDGEEVRKASGRNGEKLDVKSWDVAELIGKKASIKIVDDHKGGWGHINVDHIVFSNERANSEVQKAIWLDHGADNYAGVTWSDIPMEDGRRLFIGWMSNWQYAQSVPTREWRSAMTLPRNLTLTKVSNTYRIISNPVKELDKIVDNTDDPLNVSDSTFLVKAIIQNDFELTLNNDLGEKFKIELAGDQLIIDRSESGIVNFHSDFGNIHKAEPFNSPKEIAIYVDMSSVEVFINNGELVMTELIFPSAPFNSISSNGGLQELTTNNLKPIWK